MGKIRLYLVVCVLLAIPTIGSSQTLYTYNPNEIYNSPNLFTCGYSYSYNGANDIWVSTYGMEASLSWQKYDKVKTHYWNVKLGYQPFSFWSIGFVFSWDRKNKAEDEGIGMYTKLTLPTRYVSPFIYGQVCANKNNTFGVGLSFNLGYR